MAENKQIIQLCERAKKIRFRCLADGNSLINAYLWDATQDLRITSNRRLARLMVGLNVSFEYLSNTDQEDLLENIRLDFEKNVDIEQYLDINEIFLKIGFVSSLFFVVESVLRDYLRYLDQNAYKNCRGIIGICNCLLEEKIEWELVRFDCDVFDFLRLIRNSLHNNGVHIPLSKKEKSITIVNKEQQYTFTEGERPNFVSWDLLLDIADDMRSLLFHIANNKTIRSIPGLIIDTHAV